MAGVALGKALDVGTNDAEKLRNRTMGAGLVSDPYPLYDQLRESGPIHPGSVNEHFGVVASFGEWPDRPHFSAYDWESASAILRDTETFSSAWYKPQLRPIAGYSILEMDQPDHRRHRSLVQGSLVKQEMDRWRTRWIEPIVDDLLKRLEGRNRVDLYTEFCAHLPVRTITATFGIAPSAVDEFHELVVRMVGGAESPAQAFAASERISAILRAIIEDRRRNPHDDLITVLTKVETKDDDGSKHRLTDEEILAFAKILLPAGAGTTYRALGCFWLALLQRPDDLAAIRQDPSLLEPAIEESLRLEQPLAAVGRLVTRDTELCGVKIPAGAIVQVAIGAANHDPARWPDPHRFNIRRERKLHASFGIGAHACVGQQLARAEMMAATNALFDKFPRLGLDAVAEPAIVTGLAFRLPTAVPALLV